jgi:ribosomal protein L21E
MRLGKCSSRKAASFKVGDRVVFVYDGSQHGTGESWYPGYLGTTGTVVDTDELRGCYNHGYVMVRFDGQSDKEAAWYVAQRFDKLT